MKNSTLSGEDKVIVVCVAMLTVLTTVALIALVVQPSQTTAIIPVMAGTVIAIASLAARHPPLSNAVAVGPEVALKNETELPKP